MRWYYGELVPCPVSHTLVLTEKQFHKRLKKLRLPEKDWPEFTKNGADATVHFFEETKTGRECAIVCIRKTDHPLPQIFGLLTHEAVHIWQAYRDILGEKAPSSEFEAYAIQGIAQDLFVEYDRLTKK